MNDLHPYAAAVLDFLHHRAQRIIRRSVNELSIFHLFRYRRALLTIGRIERDKRDRRKSVHQSDITVFTVTLETVESSVNLQYM